MKGAVPGQKEKGKWTRRHGGWRSLCDSAFYLWPLAFGLTSTVLAATNSPPKNSQTPVPTTLQDIKAPLEIATIWTWLGRVIIVAVLGGLLWLGWWLWRRRKPDTEAIKRIPPHELARERLTAALSLLDQPERFCTAVSEITRTYLEDRFGLRAPEQTTEEFLAELPRSAVLDVRHKHVLVDFLTGCDLVKFARFEPARTELIALHTAALNLVEETTPTIAPAGAVPPPLPPVPPTARAVPPPPPVHQP
jgi:hypothetical protein